MFSTEGERSQMSPSGKGQNLHVYRQDLFALLSFIYNLQNCKITSYNWKEKTKGVFSILTMHLFLFFSETTCFSCTGDWGTSSTLVNLDKLCCFS